MQANNKQKNELYNLRKVVHDIQPPKQGRERSIKT